MPVKPWLSIVMPVHRGEHFLAATLASAARDGADGVEFLIYNSGIDDGVARRIAESFTDRLDIAWRDTLDLPAWTAKTNLGVRHARASHVSLLHQDDLWLPGHLAAVRHAIAAYPDAVLSVAATRFADADGRIFGHWRLPFGTGPVREDDFVATLSIQNSIAIPTPVMRRDAWLRAGGMDETLWYTADWDMYLKLAAQGQVIVRDDLTTAFRLHGGSLTMTGSHDVVGLRDQLEQVLARHLVRVPANRRDRVERRARASIDVNCALAQASTGHKAAIAGAGLHLLRLGPAEIARYVRESRIIDRLVPRLRLAMSGAL